MKAVLIGIASMAAAGVYVAGGPSGVRHERIVEEPPKAVFNMLAASAGLLKDRTYEDFDPTGNGQVEGKTLSFRSEVEPDRSIALGVLADGEPVADFGFTVEPAEGGKTRLIADIDLDGKPLGMEPQFVMLEMQSGVVLDELVKAIEREDTAAIANMSYSSLKSRIDAARAGPRDVMVHDPAATVAQQQRDREQAMRNAAKPMIDVSTDKSDR